MASCGLLHPNISGSNLLPDVSLADHARPVATPVAPGPSGALVQKLDPVLKGGFNLALPVVLDPGLPLVTHQPPGDEVVIVGIQNPGSPFLIPKTMEELVASKNLRPVGSSASRHARSAAVDVVSCRDFKVTSLNVSCTKPVPDLGRPWSIPLTAYSLAGSDAANLGVFEGGQDPRHQGRRPSDIVVCHDGEGSVDLGKSLADLESLVGNRCGEDSDVGSSHGVNQDFKVLPLLICGYKDHLKRVAGKNALQ